MRSVVPEHDIGRPNDAISRDILQGFEDFVIGIGAPTPIEITNVPRFLAQNHPKPAREAKRRLSDCLGPSASSAYPDCLAPTPAPLPNVGRGDEAEGWCAA